MVNRSIQRIQDHAVLRIQDRAVLRYPLRFQQLSMASSSTSSELLPQSLTFLIAKLSIVYYIFKLDSTNYFARKTQVETALRANSLFEYACNKGKSHRLAFPVSLTHTSAPFELIHADVWGPAPITSFSGFSPGS